PGWSAASAPEATAPRLDLLAELQPAGLLLADLALERTQVGRQRSEPGEVGLVVRGKLGVQLLDLRVELGQPPLDRADLLGHRALLCAAERARGAGARRSARTRRRLGPGVHGAPARRRSPGSSLDLRGAQRQVLVHAAGQVAEAAVE